MTPGDPSTGVFMRVYYPSQVATCDSSQYHHLWPVWADDDYLLGFVRFMQTMLGNWPSWAPRGEYRWIDQVSYIAPIMHHGSTYVWKILNGKVHCPILRNVPISGEKKWPVLVFSHGLGCSRFAYSLICADLASHGFVVAAPEHRDGSGSITFHMQGGVKTWINHKKVELGEKEYIVRNEQLKHRVKEIKNTLSLLFDLNEGANPVENVMEVEEKLEKFDMQLLKGSMDLSSPILAGHSFGGATALFALHADDRFKLGVVLDGWLFPMKEEKFVPKQPIVFINTESFMTKMNIAKMKMFLSGTTEDRRMFFIKGSVHQNHLDMPVIFHSNFIKKIIGMYSNTDPALVLDLNNKLMLHFIWKHLDQETPKEIVDYIESNHEVLIEASEKESPGDSDLAILTGASSASVGQKEGAREEVKDIS